MGCCSSRATPDGTYEPSSFAMMLAVKPTTDYKSVAFDALHTGHAKVLVVATDDGKLTMANGKVFNSGHNPAEMFIPLMHFKAAGFDLEFATLSGKPVILEMWAFPHKDKAVIAFYESIKSLLDAPKKLEDIDASLKGIAAIYLPGGHGTMINLHESATLGKLLHTAHAASLPTVALCHGPAALLSAGKVDGAEFPYNGYKLVSFSDGTDKMTPKIGYLPGPMPWLMQAALRTQGVDVLNASEKGATHVDRELISGDSPQAANKLGVLAAPILVADWAKRNN